MSGWNNVGDFPRVRAALMKSYADVTIVEPFQVVYERAQRARMLASHFRFLGASDVGSRL